MQIQTGMRESDHRSEHGRRIGLPENDSQAIDTCVLTFQASTTVSPYEVDIFGNFIVCNHDKRCENMTTER